MRRCIGAASLSLALSTLLLCCGCSKEYTSSFLNINTSRFEQNFLLSRLSDMVGESDVYDVRDDYVFHGVVTANDEGNNFYQSYILESDGAAIEILEGISNSHVRHRLGYVISVRLQGLRVTRYKGVLQLGLPNVAGGGLISFGFLSIADLYTYNCDTTAEVEPLEFTISELRAQDATISSLCGRLVRITGLRYAPSLVNDWNLSYVDNLWSGYRPFVDVSVTDGDESNSQAIWVNTSSYAKFSAMEIPSEEFSVTGILYYGTAGSYSGAPTAPIIKMRSQYDIESATTSRK